MQKMTSDAANKLIKQLMADKAKILRQEQDACCYSYLHGEEPFVPDYNFAKAQEELNDINRNIVTIKHALNVFNSTTVSEILWLTVDAMLVKMPMLTEAKLRLDRMRSVAPKTSRINMGSKASEYTVRNYDADVVEAEYRKVSMELMTLQQELNRINNSITFEVDI